MSNNEPQDSGVVVSGAMQREQEKQRRRMRDRQRRESMTTEEREKHLARRRRNYQLRRQRAGNAQSGSDGDQEFTASVHEQIIGHEPQAIMDASHCGVGQSSCSNTEFGLKQTDLDVSGDGLTGEKLSIFNKKLRLTQVKHFARSLDNFQRKHISAYLFSNLNCASRRSLRLTQVKCLARELNSSMKDATSHIRWLTTRSLRNGKENPSSPEVLRNCSDPPNIAELDSIANHDEPHMLMVERSTFRKILMWRK